MGFNGGMRNLLAVLAVVALTGCAAQPLTLRAACGELHPVQILDGLPAEQARRIDDLISRSDAEVAGEFAPISAALTSARDMSDLLPILDSIKSAIASCEAAGSTAPRDEVADWDRG